MFPKVFQADSSTTPWNTLELLDSNRARYQVNRRPPRHEYRMTLSADAPRRSPKQSINKIERSLGGSEPAADERASAIAKLASR
jgi:hypothetical protein